jgi:hypothetical protein
MKQVFLLILCLAVWVPGWSQGAYTNEKEARQFIDSMREKGRVGGRWDSRVTSTDRSYNYKLRATWLTPQILQAMGRLLEINKGLSPTEVQQILADIRPEAAHYILVELDPREGSGVIPQDWLARFGPSGVEDRQVAGQLLSEQGSWKKLIGALPRDYSYDIFIVRFPLEVREGIKVLDASVPEAELKVRIYSKMGSVRWRITPRL